MIIGQLGIVYTRANYWIMVIRALIIVGVHAYHEEPRQLASANGKWQLTNHHRVVPAGGPDRRGVDISAVFLELADRGCTLVVTLGPVTHIQILLFILSHRIYTFLKKNYYNVFLSTYAN